MWNKQILSWTVPCAFQVSWHVCGVELIWQCNINMHYHIQQNQVLTFVQRANTTELYIQRSDQAITL